MLTTIYTYVKRYSDLGGSAQENALVRPGLPISPTIYGPRNNVRMQLSPAIGAFPYAPKDGPKNDIKANGAYIAGTLELQALSEFNTANSGKK